MIIREILRQAVDMVMAYRGRMGLTMLGIVWGIAAFVILMATANGVQTGVSRSARMFGNNILMIRPGTTSKQVGGERAGRPIRLQMEDVEALKLEGTTFALVTPRRDLRVLYEYRGRSIAADLFAVKPDYMSVIDMQFNEGRFITSEDDQQGRRVVVLGSEIKNRLFGRRPAFEEDIRINGLRFTVVGSLEQTVAVAGDAVDRRGYVPVSSARLLDDDRYLSMIIAKPTTIRASYKAVAQVRSILGRKHNFLPEDRQAIRISDLIRVRSDLNLMTTGFKVIWGLLGAITLAIGGVGVMNMMFISVTERTREIGIRKALGARHRDIALQFLAEGLTITFIAGIVGIIVGILTCQVLPPLELPKSGRASYDVSAGTVIFAFAVLTITGIVSGIWPARRAGKLPPVEALRFE